MGWATPSLVVAGQTLTAAKWNQDVVENTKYLHDFVLATRVTHGTDVDIQTAYKNVYADNPVTLPTAWDEADYYIVGQVRMSTTANLLQFATGKRVVASAEFRDGTTAIGSRGSNTWTSETGGSGTQNLLQSLPIVGENTGITADWTLNWYMGIDSGYDDAVTVRLADALITKIRKA